MKLTMFVLFLCCSSLAFAQYGGVTAVLNNQPVVVQIPSHTEHASIHSLATPQYIFDGSQSNYARGVKPLWEIPVTSEAMPLGDAARLLRKQHAMAKKAEKVLSDQL